MPLVVRCQRKIFIAIAADEPMHTVMGAVIAAPAQLPQSVTFCTWILRPLDPLRGTVTSSASASVFSPTDRLPIWVTSFGVPEHHGDGSALPMLVQSGNLSFEICRTT